MTEITDQEFDQKVAALEKEISGESAAIAHKISNIQGELNKDFAEADKALEDFRKEVESGTDEEA